MRLIPSDPDIKTIVNRIFDGDINLQPNFQRGEVWGDAKKIRLIDSILRDWHVPPIHVVEIKESSKQEVLDGQQRLVAIRDFVTGEICVNGYIEPISKEIIQLDGIYYKDLPDNWRRKFDKFTIRVYSITDYLPSEPGELFYRLNQPTNLTSAEQRNAFYGPAREQVKEIVTKFTFFNLTRKEIGFSNSRMSYDDVVARLCVYIDSGNLTEKITATVLADKYRSENGFTEDTVDKVVQSIGLMSKSVRYFDENLRFNKATLLSWLVFLTHLLELDPQVFNPKLIGKFIFAFESSRSGYKGENKYFHPQEQVSSLLNIFSDRSSSRVADVSSVLIRDFIIWVYFFLFIPDELIKLLPKKNNAQFFIEDYLEKGFDFEDELLSYIQSSEWGNTL